MILIGMFDCPFMRRVAVGLRLLGVPFEHRNWSVLRDFELHIISLALGAASKSMLLLDETLHRPKEKSNAPRIVPIAIGCMALWPRDAHVVSARNSVHDSESFEIRVV